MGGTETPVVIVGGGIAGLAAAIRLSERGVRVLVLETRTKLGGRATSFDDVRTGLTIDNCQHVALGCCTNYLDLLGRLGKRDAIDWQSRIHFVEPGGRTSTLEPSAWIPAPSHSSPSLLAASFLSAGDKLGITRAVMSILRADRGAHEQETFSAWLGRHEQSERAIRRFWEPVVVSACNLPCDKVSARVALHVFQEGMLAHKDAGVMGVPTVPLRELYDSAESLITRAGGEIRLRTSVAEVDAESVTLIDGTVISAQRVILAVPPERAVKLAGASVRAADDRFDRMAGLTHSPILGVHIGFDRPVMRTKNAVLVDQETQWVFRKDADGSRVHAVISAATDWLGMKEQEIAGRVLADIRACMPWASDAQAVSVRAVTEKRATWAPLPGAEALRPATEGASGILIAGSHAQTGWPCTMEGATRSGYLAAEAVMGGAERLLCAPLTPGLLVRAMAGSWASAAAHGSE